MDPDKIEAVDSWPTPRMVRALRGFLGLTGYYWKFIARYGDVVRPLTHCTNGTHFDGYQRPSKHFKI
jgi:hypothetical protein